MAQWLGFQAFTARAQGQTLVRELRSCKPGGTAEKEKRKGERLDTENSRLQAKKKPTLADTLISDF